MRSSTVALRTARTMALMALIMTWTWYTDLILPSSESSSLNYAESVCKTQITTMRAKSNYCKSIRGVWPVQLLSSLVWYSSNVESIYWEHSPPLLTFEAWLFQCKQVKAIGTKDHALMRQDALNTSRAVVEAVKASAWTKWLSEFIIVYIYIYYVWSEWLSTKSLYKPIYVSSNFVVKSVTSLNSLMNRTARTYYRLRTASLEDSLSSFFALKWLHQYTASLKMPNEKIRHGIACTMLHQFCTVQLSIIRSWPLQNAAKTKAVYKTRDPACGSSLRRTWKQRLKQHGCWGF